MTREQKPDKRKPANAATQKRIERVDKYHITIDGFPVHATRDQEQRIRELDDNELRKFRRIMGG